MSKIKVSEELRKADRLLSAGRLDEARGVYSGILRVFPGNAKAKLGLSRIPARQASAPARDPSIFELNALLEDLKNGRHAEIPGRVTELLKSFPNSINLYNILGLSKKDAGDLTGAIDAFEKVVRLAPDSPEGHMNLGSAYHLAKQVRAAEQHLRKAIALRPGYGKAHAELGDVMKEADLHEEAILTYRQALKLMPDRTELYLSIGNELAALGELDKALEQFDLCLAADGPQGPTYRSKAAALHRQNRRDEARDAIDKGLQIDPRDGGLHRLMSRTRKYSKDDPHLKEMLDLYGATDLPDEDRSELCYALAKAAQDTGDPGPALAYMKEGGKLRKVVLGYDIEEDRELFRNIKTAYLNIQRVKFTPKSNFDVTPIFILGMPRSGTTLTEQILSSHSMVIAGDELSFVDRFGRELTDGTRVPTPESLEDFREKYLRGIKRLAKGSPFVTDKMPHNFRFIGTILKAMPEARIVHMKRDARAVCWSNFEHYFPARGLAYTFDLNDVVDYYHLYRDLMTYWDLALPGRILHLDYEKLTESPEPEIRRLLQSLSLPWEDACLSPEKNLRSSKTASQLQIQKPIYKGSSAAWKKYEPFLDGAFDAL